MSNELPPPYDDDKAPNGVRSDVKSGSNGYPVKVTDVSAPPSYIQRPPDITAQFAALDLEEKPRSLADRERGRSNENAEVHLPSQEQCIAHLKLLETFHQLKEDIGTTDGLFGISNRLADGNSQQEAVLTKIAEKRWAIYVARAADRFEQWWQSSIPASTFRPSGPIEQQYMAYDNRFEFESLVDRCWPMQFDEHRLPPIDILMVWHAYMLNPRSFLEDCIRNGKMDFWRTGMPWAAVNACIDNSSFEYNPSTAAKETFTTTTDMAWDNLQDPMTKILNCMRCPSKNSVPWTECDLQYGSQSPPSEPLLLESSGHGFADKNLRAVCPKCGFVTTHETLRVQKFKKDLQQLLQRDTPMPGTILQVTGKPQAASKRYGLRRHPVTFPNRLLTAGLKTKVLEIVDRPNRSSEVSMNQIKNVIEAEVMKKTLVRKANDRMASGNLLRLEKIAVRRMMSHYWDNSSIFALDLVGAVIRQGSFVEKMHNIDWLHSPSLSATIHRLIIKYTRFFEILKKNEGKTAVPTLDVDLAWHTNQLSPQRYYDYSVTMTNKFIDHDDKIDENKLSDAFEWTSKQYQTRFNEVYSQCTCWYCESIRESHNSSVSRIFGSNPSPSPESCAHEAHKSVHISAHNAVRTEDSTIRSSIKEAQLEALYQKALRRAEKNGKQKPISREEYYYSYAWGYPVYVPQYAPYMCDPSVSAGMYPGNPACMTTTAGAPGNCAAGTCGGTVAAGGCAGTALGGGCAGVCGGGGGGCVTGGIFALGGDGGGGGDGGCGGGCGS